MGMDARWVLSLRTRHLFCARSARFGCSSRITPPQKKRRKHAPPNFPRITPPFLSSGCCLFAHATCSVPGERVCFSHNQNIRKNVYDCKTTQYSKLSSQSPPLPFRTGRPSRPLRRANGLPTTRACPATRTWTACEGRSTHEIRSQIHIAFQEGLQA